MDSPSTEFANRFNDLLAGDLTVSNRSTRTDIAVKIDVSEAVRQGFLPKAPRKGGFLKIEYIEKISFWGFFLIFSSKQLSKTHNEFHKIIENSKKDRK